MKQLFVPKSLLRIFVSNLLKPANQQQEDRLRVFAVVYDHSLKKISILNMFKAQIEKKKPKFDANCKKTEQFAE